MDDLEVPLFFGNTHFYLQPHLDAIGWNSDRPLPGRWNWYSRGFLWFQTVDDGGCFGGKHSRTSNLGHLEFWKTSGGHGIFSRPGAILKKVDPKARCFQGARTMEIYRFPTIQSIIKQSKVVACLAFHPSMASSIHPLPQHLSTTHRISDQTNNWANLLAQVHPEHRTQPFSQSPTPCDTWHGDAQMPCELWMLPGYMSSEPQGCTDIRTWRHPGRLNRIQPKMSHCLVVPFPQACVLGTPGWGLKSLLRRPTCGASAPNRAQDFGIKSEIQAWKHMKTTWTSRPSVRPSDSQHQWPNRMQSFLVKLTFNEVHLEVILPRGLAGIGSIYQDCLFSFKDSGRFRRILSSIWL